MIAFVVRALKDEDRGYVLASMRESHKQAPGNDRVPWSYFKASVGQDLARLINDPTTRLLGAYADDALLGYLIMTPGKRIATLHWIQTKHAGGELRRRGIATALFDAANLGTRFVYTLRARRDRTKLANGTTTRSLDESLVQTLAARGIAAVYEPLKEWLK